MNAIQTVEAFLDAWWHRGRQVVSIDAHTEVMLTHPRELANVIVGLVDQAADFSRMCTPHAEPRPITWASPTLAFPI